MTHDVHLLGDVLQHAFVVDHKGAASRIAAAANAVLAGDTSIGIAEQFEVQFLGLGELRLAGDVLPAESSKNEINGVTNTGSLTGGCK